MSDGISIQSILLSEDRVEVCFAEERHITATGLCIEALQFDTAAFQPDVDTVHGTLADLIGTYAARTGLLVNLENITVQSAMFGPDQVEVTFVEQRHRTNAGTRIRTIRFPMTPFQEHVDETIEALSTLISTYEVMERNPPETIPVPR